MMCSFHHSWLARLLEPRLGDVPVVVDVVVVEDHHRRDRGEQPANLRVAPALEVELRVVLEVEHALTGRLGRVAPGLDERARAGRHLVGVDLVAEHQQHVGPALARLVAHAQGHGAEGVDLAPALVLVLLQRERRLMRRGHAARAERDLERLLLRVGVERARREAVVLLRPDALAVELHVVLVPAAAARGRRSRRARSGGRTRRRCARGCRGSPPRRRSRSRPRGRPRSRRRIGAGVRVRARACWDGTPGSSFRIVESQLQEVGRSIHAAFPGKSRHPLRALDERAMQLASHDAELRAALFRFVDVTPACRSLDDLARHLTGYLEEVDDRPPPIEAAMRMSGTKAGRAALGAAAAAGVRHMAHRFIVGETPEGRSQDDPPPLGERGGRVAGPAWRGDRDRGGGRPLCSALPRRARDPGRSAPLRGRSGRCSRRTRSAGCRA